MFRTYAAQATFLSLAAAWLLASTQIQRPDDWPLAGLYVYWTIRIIIEAGLFIGFAELISRLSGPGSNVMLNAILAALVSLVPFVLSITALDLILGLPELGGTVSLDNTSGEATSGQALAESQIGSFFLEIIYLSDNHLALCAILTAPKLFQTFSRTNAAKDIEPILEPETSETDGAAGPDVVGSSDRSSETGYLRHLDQPLNGELLRVEAQEHYVRLVSDQENRMVLYRFNDIVSELPGKLGMQVHRSHWVAFAAAESLYRDSGRLWLTITDGSKIPVSRKYSEDVQSRFGSSA